MRDEKKSKETSVELNTLLDETVKDSASRDFKPTPALLFN